MTDYSVTIHLTVTDEKALRKAAEARAVKDGLDLKAWRKQRTSISDDLMMLFDPGVSPDGTEIHETSVDDDTCEPYEFSH